MSTSTDPPVPPVRCPKPDCQALMIEVKRPTGSALVCSAPIDHPKTPMHGGCFPLPAAERAGWLKRMAKEKKAMQVASLPTATLLPSIRRPAGGGLPDETRSLGPQYYALRGLHGLWQQVAKKADGAVAGNLYGRQRMFLRNVDAEADVLLALSDCKVSPPEPEAPDDGEADA